MPLVVVVELVDAEYLGAFDVVYGIVPDHEGLPLGLAPCLQVVLPADAGEPFYRVSEDARSGFQAAGLFRHHYRREIFCYAGTAQLAVLHFPETVAEDSHFTSCRAYGFQHFPRSGHKSVLADHLLQIILAELPCQGLILYAVPAECLVEPLPAQVFFGHFPFFVHGPEPVVQHVVAHKETVQGIFPAPFFFLNHLV